MMCVMFQTLENALLKAVIRGHVGILKALIGAGAAVNGTCRVSGAVCRSVCVCRGGGGSEHHMK